MFATAFIMGLAGSLHCLGMCSPLVMAVTNFRGPFFLNRLIYNVGRILVYGIMGMSASAFGSIFHLSGLQSIVTFVLAGVLFVLGLTGLNVMERITGLSILLQKFSTFTRRMFASVLKEKKRSSYFLLGTLNGLLPCGLTYMALTYCFIIPDLRSGFLFMIIFGAGTLGVMLGFTSALKFLMDRYQFSLKRFSAIAMVTMAVILFYRGTLQYQEGKQQPHDIVICR